MTEDLTALPDDELHARRRALYAQVQEAGCPGDIVLAFNALTDEHDRRRGDIRSRLDRAIVCGSGDIEQEWDQPPGPEWGA